MGMALAASCRPGLAHGKLNRPCVNLVLVIDNYDMEEAHTHCIFSHSLAIIHSFRMTCAVPSHIFPSYDCSAHSARTSQDMWFLKGFRFWVRRARPRARKGACPGKLEALSYLHTMGYVLELPI